MRILFVSDVYFPRVNGISTSIRTFAHALQAFGHAVHLVAPEYTAHVADEDWIRRMPARRSRLCPEDAVMRYGSVLERFARPAGSRYDIVHVHTPFVAHRLGLKLARLFDIPCIETCHTFPEDHLHHYLPWIPRGTARGIARLVSRHLYNRVDAVVVPSQPMRDILRHCGVTSRIEVIATGLPEQGFAEADGMAFRRKYRIPQERPLLLYVGRAAVEKNIGFLLRMAAELRTIQPDLLLVIASRGPEERNLHRLAAELNLKPNVLFIGDLDRDIELNACYCAADVFVFASRTETQGLVLLEAMAQGTPVVALAERGTRSILVDGEGALIAPEDERIFARKVHALL